MTLLDRPRPADRVRQVAVVVGTAVAIVGAFLGSGAAGGTPIQNAADGAFGPDATLLAPAVPAFSIWSVIYLGLIAYAVRQALPRQASRAVHRSIGWWVLGSALLNAAWILVVQAGSLPLSLVVIAVLLAVLVTILARLRSRRRSGWIDALVIDGTMGLYLGWVLIATVADATAVLVRAGFTGAGIDPGVWGVLVLCVAGVIAVALAVWDRGRLAPAIATAWGCFWIGIARATGTLASTPVAVTAFVVAGAILVAALAVRLTSRRRA
ncbi:tryptophan-rich sensory protein [uncultured Microbacterium sp.]|uniref:tryptophan-rich sensory protein n=1 Tax=uncultured Microbacterium sp. TaxID=191216 RepID=UPI0025E95EE7|nr:tryptophan-rich sensory protein [uncultured Microbacterium sp.]